MRTRKDAPAQPFALSPHIIGISLALLFVTCPAIKKKTAKCSKSREQCHSSVEICTCQSWADDSGNKLVPEAQNIMDSVARCASLVPMQLADVSLLPGAKGVISPEQQKLLQMFLAEITANVKCGGHKIQPV